MARQSNKVRLTSLKSGFPCREKIIEENQQTQFYLVVFVVKNSPSADLSLRGASVARYACVNMKRVTIAGDRRSVTSERARARGAHAASYRASIGNRRLRISYLGALSIQKQYFGRSGGLRHYSYTGDLCRNTPPINTGFSSKAPAMKSIALSKSVPGHGSTWFSKNFNFRVHRGIIVSGRRSIALDLSAILRYGKMCNENVGQSLRDSILGLKFTFSERKKNR